MPPFSKNSGEHKFLLDSLDSFFKRKFKVSSLQENQVWSHTDFLKTRKRATIFFQPEISGSCTQLLGEREIVT